jgi:LysM repeat protein
MLTWNDLEGAVKRTLSRLAWLLVILSLTFLLVACERMLREEPVTPGSGLGIPTLDPQSTPLLPPAGASPTTDPLAQPATPETVPAETPVPAEPTPVQDVTHTVVAGDTLGNLAAQYGISAEQIAAANNITLTDTLAIGQQLLIPLSGQVQAQPTAAPPPAAEATAPPPVTEERIHTVQAGENLYRIGLQYGFTIEALATYNNLANPNRLEVGQQIRIPPDGYTVP